jgi:hypothetical protein
VKAFWFWAALTNPSFSLEILTLLPLFNDKKISSVDKKRPYELDGKKKLDKTGFE